MAMDELTATERNRRRLLELVRELQGNSDRGACVIDVMDQMWKEGLPRSEFSRYLAGMIKEGLVFETDQEHIRIVR